MRSHDITELVNVDDFVGYVERTPAREGGDDETDDELRERLRHRAPRPFDELALMTVVFCEADKLLDPPRSLRAERTGVASFVIYGDGGALGVLSRRVSELIPPWIAVEFVPETKKAATP